LLSNYYGAYFKAFYNQILAEGGGILAEAFISELQSVAEQHNWLVRIHSSYLLDVAPLTLLKTQEALPVLFETAKQFVAKIVDQDAADTGAQKVRSQFDESILKNIALYKTMKE